MSVVGIEILINGAPSGFDRLAFAFERAGAEMVQLGKYVFPKLSQLMEKQESQQFDEEGVGPRGSWAPLSSQYAKWKEQHYPGKRILERTGKLRAALTAAGANARRDFTDTDFTFGTAGVPYASIHMTGYGQGDHVGMPARPPVDFGSDFAADVEVIAREGMREAIRQSDPIFSQEAP